MAHIEAAATISSKGQLTLPKPIRSALGLVSGTRVNFVLDGDEMRVLKIADDGDHHDPTLNAFLDLLEKDMESGTLDTELPADVVDYARTRDLSNVDTDEVIKGDVEL